MPKKVRDATLLAVTFAALGDPTRVRLVQELSGLHGRQEACVGELVKRLRVRQPTVSHHLSLLRLHGLVSARAEGKRKFYSLNPRAFAETADLLACFALCMRARTGKRPRG